MRILTALALGLFLSQTTVAQQIDQVADDLANQIASSLKSGDKNKIAVLGFTDLSDRSIPFGHLISDELIAKLFAKSEGRFQIVERSKLEQVLSEQRLSLSGLLEEKTVQAAGQIAGVDALLTGTIATLEGRLRINVRLIAVPSAKLFSTASAFMDLGGVPADLLRPSSSGSQRAKPIARKDFKDFSFELLECIHSAGLITCKFILTNNGDDSWISIGRGWPNQGILMYDQRGYLFEGEDVKIADIRDRNPQKLLITGIPTSLQIFFEGIPAAVESIKILKMETSLGTVEFRDIALSEG